MRENVLALVFVVAWFNIVACAQKAEEPNFANPIIKMGKVTIMGNVTGIKKRNLDSLKIVFGMSHPITGEVYKKEVVTDSCGHYSVGLNLETNPSLVAVCIGHVTTVVDLGRESKVRLDINLLEDGTIQLQSEMKSDLTNYDKSALKKIDEIMDYHSDREHPVLYGKTPEYYLEATKPAVRERMAMVERDTLLGKCFKDYLMEEVRLFCAMFYFDYEDAIRRNYKTIKNTNVIPDTLKITTPSLNYYKFMEKLGFGGKYFLYSFISPNIQDYVNTNDTLAIVPIGETPVDKWLAKTKERLAPLLGFHDGVYYDVLVANSYASSMNVHPLTEIQKRNIRDYFKNNEIEKILLRYDKEACWRVSFREPLLKYETKAATPDQLMSEIICNNVGKVIVVDLWATWCSPCLSAIKDMGNVMIPATLKDVAHVYITNESSPKNLWKKKILGIGGQHYRIGGDLWNKLLDKYSFEGIPSYLLFDTEGCLRFNFTGYPGNEKISELIKLCME